MAIIQTAHGAINQYMGARYVPKLMDDWSESVKYDYLNQVNYFGDAYISKKPVPLGTPPTDTEYWMRFPYGERLDTLFAEIVAANKAIDKNAKDIIDLGTQLDADVNNLQGNINQLDNKLVQTASDLQANINGVDSKLTQETAARQTGDTALQNGIDGLTGRMTTAESNINTLASGVSGLQTRVTKNESDIAGLQGQIGSTAGDITALQNQVNTNTANITSLQGKVADNTVKITALTNDYSTLQTRVASNETSIINLQAEDSSLDARLTTAEDTLGAHGTTLQQHNTRITALENYSAPEQIGYIDVTYPPASSGLIGIPNDGTDNNNVTHFNAIVAYAQQHGYGLQFGSGTFNLNPSVTIDGNIYIKGLGTKSKINGWININGQSGIASIIDQVEFLNIVSALTDTTFNNCIFRNSALYLNGARQIYINSCQFFHTNNTLTTNCITFESYNENIKISQCVFLSEEDVGNAINISAPASGQHISINATVAGFKTAFILDNLTNGIIYNCDVYNVSRFLSMHNSAISITGSIGISLDTQSLNYFISGNTSDLKITSTILNSINGVIFMESGNLYISSSELISRLNVPYAIIRTTSAAIFISSSRLISKNSSNSIFMTSNRLVMCGCNLGAFTWNQWYSGGGAICKLYGCSIGNDNLPSGNPSWITVL